MGNIKIIGGSFETKLELKDAGVQQDFPVRLTIIGMRRWTSTVTIYVTLKPRSMAMWRETR